MVHWYRDDSYDSGEPPDATEQPTLDAFGRDVESFDDDTDYCDDWQCPACGSPYARIVANLGCVRHFNCRDCGMWSNRETPR